MTFLPISSARLLPVALAVALGSGSAMAFELEPSVNLQYDIADASDAPEGADDEASDVRRARFGVSGGFGERWKFKLEHDFKPGAWTDAYLEYRGERITWRGGQFKQPLGLEQLNSDRTTMFVDNAAADVVSFGRRIGFGAEMPFARGRVIATVFDQDLRGNGAGGGYALRGVFNPVRSESATLHLAAAAVHEDPDGDRFSVNSSAEANVLPLRPAGTGAVTDVDTIDRYGLEAAWLSGPLTLQSEWLRIDFDRDASADADAQSAYLSASWVLTGESRGYNGSTIGAPKPSRRWGAVELVARVSQLDYDTPAARGGGELDNVAVGVNWYLGADTRLMADLVRSENGFGDDVDLAVVRLQLAF